MKKKPIRQAISALLVAGFFAGIVWPGYLDYSYLATKPRTPDLGTGRVFPFMIKSAFIYLNQQELSYANFVRYDVFYFGIFCLVAIAFIQEYFPEK